MFDREYLKKNPSLRKDVYASTIKQNIEQRSFCSKDALWNNIVTYFFPKDQQSNAYHATEDQKDSLIALRCTCHQNEALANELSAIENAIVDAHRRPFPDQDKVDLDPAIRTDNRKFIAEIDAQAAAARQQFKDEIASIGTSVVYALKK